MIPIQHFFEISSGNFSFGQKTHKGPVIGFLASVEHEIVPELIHAIDPSADLIRAARKNLPTGLAKQIRYQVGSAERLKYPPNSFDIVVFSWVL